MTNITKTAEAKVDIWKYVNDLVKENLVNEYVFQKQLVEYVYRNDAATYEHILLPTSDANCFIVIIVSLSTEAIYGHYKLDLIKKYF